jgi:ribonucleoside-diphosphate reductase alpha subunit
MITVTKRNGAREALDIKKIQKYTCESVENLKNVSQSELELDAQLQFRDGMMTEEIQSTLIQTAVDKIDVDCPDWTFVASRLFLYDLYHKVGRVLGTSRGKRYPHLRTYMEYNEKNGRIYSGLMDKFDLDELNEYLVESRDFQFNYLGIRTLYDRYLLKNVDKEPSELPQLMFMGVAMFLAQNEKDNVYWAKKFYDILSKFEVMAATPTLSNSRTNNNQLSSCFKKDSLVNTITGLKEISEIENGEFVLTHNKRYKKVINNIKHMYKGDFYELKVFGKPRGLNATKEHPILVLDKKLFKCDRKYGSCFVSQGKKERCFKLVGEYKKDCEHLNRKFIPDWKKISDVNPGDYISVSFPRFVSTNIFYIKDFLPYKDNVLLNGKIMQKRSNASFFMSERDFLKKTPKPVNNEIIFDEDMMLYIGYFLAEGHIGQDKNHITFTFGAKEKDYIKDTVRITKEKFGIDSFVTENQDNSVDVTVHNVFVAKFFYKLMGTGFDKKKLIPELMFIDPKYQQYLLVGVFRGDACSVCHGIKLTMCNDFLISQLYEISLRCGLSPYIAKGKKMPILGTMIPSHLIINVRKDEKFIRLINKDLHKINTDLDRNTGVILRYFWHEDNFYTKVLKSKKIKIKDYVYNLQVEDDETYCIENLQVHNCYIGATSDNIEGIFDAYHIQSLLSKYGGGIGWDWSKVRAQQSMIDGHKNVGGGIVPFLKIENDVAIAVDQLGCVAKNSFVKILDKVETNKEIYKTVKISDVKVNDLILSFNTEEGKLEYKKVLKTYDLEVKEKDQIKIEYENGGYIITSDWHPTCVYKNDKYVYERADKVKVGDIGVYHSSNSKFEHSKIKSITKPNIDSSYFDLTVDGNNNYFCSTDNENGNYHVIHNTRKGAIAVYIEPWHMDVLDFLDLKKNSGEERRRAHDLFPALWINDLFMKRVDKDAEWTLFDPYETGDLTDTYGDDFEQRYLAYENRDDISKVNIKAKDLWKKILLSYFETGSPFLGFKDTANKANPNRHAGLIRSSNLCTEIFQNTGPGKTVVKVKLNNGELVFFDENEMVELNNGRMKKASKLRELDVLESHSDTGIFHVYKEIEERETAVCNLASINLSKVNTKEKIEEIVPIAVRMLDNVIDLNFYPELSVKETNIKSRAIGLGMMGEAQMLAEEKIYFGSQEHRERIDEVCELLSYNAIKGSMELSKEKGSYPNFVGSNWSQGIMPIDIANEKARNLTKRLFTYNWNELRAEVMKNGIRNGYLMAIAPTSSISILTGTTPTIEPVYKRKWFEENLSGLIPVCVPNLNTETWQYYESAFDIDQIKIVETASIRQKWIDQGQSLNIFMLLNKANGKTLNEIYMTAWQLGCKSTYYLRSQSPEAIIDENEKLNSGPACSGCE